MPFSIFLCWNNIWRHIETDKACFAFVIAAYAGMVLGQGHEEMDKLFRSIVSMIVRMERHRLKHGGRKKDQDME